MDRPGDTSRPDAPWPEPLILIQQSLHPHSVIDATGQQIELEIRTFIKFPVDLISFFARARSSGISSTSGILERGLTIRQIGLAAHVANNSECCTSRSGATGRPPGSKVSSRRRARTHAFSRFYQATSCRAKSRELSDNRRSTLSPFCVAASANLLPGYPPMRR